MIAAGKRDKVNMASTDGNDLLNNKMEDCNQPNNVLEFKRPDTEVSFRRKKTNKWLDQKPEHWGCRHLDQEFDEEMDLVQCCKCGKMMSFRVAYLAIMDHWSDVKERVADWEKVKQMEDEQEKERKRDSVRRTRRELQYIELPNEGDEPARSYWLRLRQALGKEPYAIFKQGRGKIQWCVLDSSSTWSDADYILSTYEAEKAVMRTDAR